MTIPKTMALHPIRVLGEIKSKVCGDALNNSWYNLVTDAHVTKMGLRTVITDTLSEDNKNKNV